jgi:hypothetical protein
MSIAALMILWGTLATQRAPDNAPAVPLARKTWIPGILGILLALYVFMADAIAALQEGRPVGTELPMSFNWPLFAIALALMAIGVADFGRRARRMRAA